MMELTRHPGLNGSIYGGGPDVITAPEYFYNFYTDASMNLTIIGNTYDITHGALNSNSGYANMVAANNLLGHALVVNSEDINTHPAAYGNSTYSVGNNIYILDNSGADTLGQNGGFDFRGYPNWCITI